MNRAGSIIDLTEDDDVWNIPGMHVALHSSSCQVIHASIVANRAGSSIDLTKEEEVWDIQGMHVI